MNNFSQLPLNLQVLHYDIVTASKELGSRERDIQTLVPFQSSIIINIVYYNQKFNVFSVFQEMCCQENVHYILLSYIKLLK